MDRGGLFTEAAYVSALHDEHLQNRCSNCFAPASSPCKKCRSVVYCNDFCSGADCVHHSLECVGFRNEMIEPRSIDVRLLLRFSLRRCFDDGVAALSPNFPDHIKNRTCKDLKSHRRGIEKDSERWARVQYVWKCSRRVFDGTRSLFPFSEKTQSTLSEVFSKSDVERLCCVLAINAMGIIERTPINQPQPWKLIGAGLYLNASRFDHSCDPDLVTTFSGNRLHVAEGSPNRRRITECSYRYLSSKRFNRLTVNYETWSNDVANCAVRSAWLKSNYYFECRCKKCDRDRSILENYASCVVCSRCRSPFVWRHEKYEKLRPMCSCESAQTERIGCSCSCSCCGCVSLQRIRKIDIPTTDSTRTLDAMYVEIMRSTEDPTSCDESTIRRIEDALARGSEYWHPTWNLRVGHSNERLFYAYVKEIEKTAIGSEKRAEMIQRSIEAGEAMIRCYDWGDRLPFPDWRLKFTMQRQLAVLYQAAPSKENLQKAYEIYRQAGVILKYICDKDAAIVSQ